MLKFYSDTKIFVLCPSGVVTGGTELLHQLVGYLREHGKDAYIVYMGDNKDIPSDYLKYNVKVAVQIEDTSHNIEVICEGYLTKFIKNSVNTQKMIWWLSVDHFFMFCKDDLLPFDYMRYDKWGGCKMLVKLILKSLKFINGFKDRLSLKYLSDINAVNAYQSEYAQTFLLKHKFPNVVPLKDYINVDFLLNNSCVPKEDIVLYNPKKGLEFTKKIISYAPDIKWIPIQNMNREDVCSLMRRAKVYIDFGYHPGKDRLPRECAMNKCCIITNRLGSAAFFEDVSIDNQYKFANKSENIPQIIFTIKRIFKEYDILVSDFSFYRHSISCEKSEFELQVKRLFYIK